jgi:alkanesulfonate monooxygenase SsuD/methylene tetrahydromethanopterin reductase-like flavin-dependent oxidoreductase (luciferase family)
MKYGAYVETVGGFADAELLASLAAEAEAHGWDGFMIWDVIHLTGEPVVDSWAALALIADRTERIRIGPLVTPIARRRPTTLARQTVAIDRISKGRLTCGVGLGGEPDVEFMALGENPDPKTRAAMLDEGLEVLQGLWRGDWFTFSGNHQTVRNARFQPTPVQSPRIPIWVAAIWPSKAPLRRAARWDGLAPIHPRFIEDAFHSVEEIAAMREYVDQHRVSKEPFDIVFFAGYLTNAPRPAPDVIAAYENAGGTWWLETLRDPEQAFELIRLGPPPR